MKRKPILFFVTIVIAVLAMMTLVACGDKGSGGSGGGGTPDTPPAEQLKKFDGVKFENATFDYDGSEKSITVTGLPEGAKVVYTNNKGTDAGVYNAKAVVTKDGYERKELTATLTINKINFTGIEFSGKTVTYDATEHKLDEATGVPSFADVKYTGTMKETNAGVYSATVTVTNKNYNDFTKTVQLEIQKAELGEIKFENGTFEYDEQEHSIQISGLVPTGEIVVYSGGENGRNGARSVGTYTIVAKVGGKNYNQKTLTATLKIKSTEEELATTLYNGKIYFENPLDNKWLYCIDGNEIKLVNRDVASSFVQGGGKLYYLAQNYFGKGVVGFDGAKAEDLYSVNGKYLATDGTFLYYSVSSLLDDEKNGIYSLKISDLYDTNAEPSANKLCADKAEELTVIGNYVYFVAKSGGKLYRIDKNASNGSSQLVYDYKVSDLATDGTRIFFTRHITLSNLKPGAAIYSIDTTTASLPVNDDSVALKKITYSKGKYLTVVGEYLYFVNTDMVTTTIFGDGIYKVKIDGSEWKENVIGGTKVVDGENDNVFALSTDGTVLYYFRANNKHLYSYNIGRKVETDLMAGYVAPVYQPVITTYYEEMKEYNGELYYIDMKDNGKLHKYNIQSGFDVRITSLQVADFAIYENELYYATVRLMTNFDLYKMNLVTGVNTRISTEKCLHMSFMDGKIYYANFSDKNTLNVMNLDGSEDTVLVEKGVNGFKDNVDDYDVYAINGKVYFVASELYCYDVATKTATKLNKDVKPNEYLFTDENTVFLMNDRALKNTVSKYDVKNNVLTDVADLGTTNDARSFFVSGKYVYYYRNVAAGSSNKGLYRVDMTASTLTSELVSTLDGYYMSSAVVVGNKVYFLDVWQVKGTLPTTSSTGKLCVFDLTSKTVTELQ